MMRFAVVGVGLVLLIIADALIHRRAHRSRIDRLKRAATSKGE